MLPLPALAHVLRRCLWLALAVVVLSEARPATALDARLPLVPPNPVARPALLAPAPAVVALPAHALPLVVPQPVAPPGPAALMPDTGITCLAQLADAGVTFTAVGRHEGEGACGVDDGVSVSALPGVVLEPAALVSCPTALAFARFWADTLAGAARTHLGQQPAIAHVAASYVCRGRNNVPGARLSEHGFGRAIDVRAITLADGQRWSVRPHAASADDGDARFQAAFREAACGPFTTVLGPGSDGHHEDHIHLDNAPRSRVYCR